MDNYKMQGNVDLLCVLDENKALKINVNLLVQLKLYQLVSQGRMNTSQSDHNTPQCSAHDG